MLFMLSELKNVDFLHAYIIFMGLLLPRSCVLFYLLLNFFFDKSKKKFAYIRYNVSVTYMHVIYSRFKHLRFLCVHELKAMAKVFISLK